MPMRIRRGLKRPPTLHRPHMIYTEVQTLEEACDVIAEARRRKELSLALKGKPRKRSLRRTLSAAKAATSPGGVTFKRPTLAHQKAPLPPPAPPPPKSEKQIRQEIKEKWDSGWFRVGELSRMYKVKSDYVRDIIWGVGTFRA